MWILTVDLALKRLSNYFVPALLVYVGLSFSFSAHASEQLIVVGAIGSGTSEKGVVLLKDGLSKRVFAVKVGQKFGDKKSADSEALSGSVESIDSGYVHLTVNGEKQKLRIGDNSGKNYSLVAKRRAGVTQIMEGMERENDEIRVTQNLKDHLIKNKLSEILMQAAAVPSFEYEGGPINGFQLLEIQENSIFEKIGMQDGDVVTAINDTELTGAGVAIQTLNQLRASNVANFRVKRGDSVKEIKIVVQ